MRHDPWLTEISPDDIEAAMQRKAAREALIVEQAAEITRLRAALATARLEGMKEAADLCDDLPDHQGGICAIAIRTMIDEEDKNAAIRAASGEGKP